MSTSIEIAQAAATAVAGAMGTQAWGFIRGQCADLFEWWTSPKEAEDVLSLLDTYALEMRVDDEARRDELIRRCADTLGGRYFAPLAARSPEAKTALADLTDLAIQRTQDSVTTSGQTFTNITAHGDFNFSGRDTNTKKGL